MMKQKKINPALLLLIKKSLAMPRPQPLSSSASCLNPFPSFKLTEERKTPHKDFFDPYIEVCFFTDTPMCQSSLETIVLASICKPDGVSVCVNANNNLEEAKSSFLILNQLEIPFIFAPSTISFLEEMARLWLLDKRMRVQVYPFSDYLSYYVSKLTGHHSASNDSLPSIIAHSVYKKPEYKLNILRFFEKVLPFQFVSDSIKKTCTPLTIQRGQKEIDVRNIEESISSCSKFRELIVYCRKTEDAHTYISEIRALSKLTDVTISVPCLNATEILSVGEQLQIPMVLRFNGGDKGIYKKALVSVFDAWANSHSANYSIYPLAAFIGNASKKLFIKSKSKVSCPDQSLYGSDLKLIEKDVEDYIYSFLRDQKENILDVMRKNGA